MDLNTYFLLHTDRNILKNPHYFPIYERHLRRYVGHPVTMFEIGTGDGGSCRMWKHFFGPAARIVTIDIVDKRSFAESQVFVRTGDQSDPKFLGELVKEFGQPTIVFDDGSHQMGHINATFDVLMPQVPSGGTYLVEDLDGAYWHERGGGLRDPRSFVERSKGLVDEMNARFTRGELKPSPCGENIVSISFYQMIVVFEKASYMNITMTRTPTPLEAT